MQRRLAVVASRVAAAAQRRTDALTDDRSRQLDAVLAVLAHDYDACGPVDADDVVATLADGVGLDPVEAELLVVAAAPDLDPNLALAYGLLSGRNALAPATVALALELGGLATASTAGAELLVESGRLLADDLVEVVGDGPWLTRTLRVPDRVRRHLLGVTAPTLAVQAAAIDATPVAGAAAAELGRALEAGTPLVYLHAPGSTAGLATAAAALAAAGLDCLAVDARLVTDDDLASLLRDAAREAALRSRGLVVQGAEVLLAAEGRARLWAGLHRCPAPVVAVGSRPWDRTALRAVPLSATAPLLLAAERRQVWTDALGFEPADEPGHPPLSGLRLPPEDIVATADYARTLARSRDAELDTAIVREAARVLGSTGSTGGSAGGANEPAATWDDLVLPPYVLDELQRLVRWAAHRDVVLARGDVHGRGKGTGLTALFTGGPGTGKTLAAHVVADELNLDLLQVDLSSVVDKYIGETEKNLEKVFREAESRNVVLFFDEADALFGNRSSVKDARDRYANQEVSYLLQRMEQFEGITLLATNLRGNLDPAFSRRMQFIVHFRDPDEPTRRRLWHEHLQRAGGTDPDDPVDLTRLASAHELAGGDIRNIVLAAAYDAAADGRAIGMHHVQEAAVREYRKLGRRGTTGDGAGPA